MSGKTSKPESTNQWSMTKTQENDITFGPPPEEYSYRCSRCGYEMEVNEAIIDFEFAWAESEGTCPEGCMPVLVCPHCNQETMEYVRD